MTQRRGERDCGAEHRSTPAEYLLMSGAWIVRVSCEQIIRSGAGISLDRGKGCVKLFVPLASP